MSSMATAPSGTVTFVFTDIEGSTERWERFGSAMADAVARHDATLRQTFENHAGYVFKTVGDAFCVAFHRVSDAVDAIYAVMRELDALDFSAVGGLQVRAALHTGEAVERDGDYFGPTVNRVARLLAIGHGGQILVSQVTADLVSGLLPEGLGLRELGRHRLKDLATPENVFQLTGAGLRAEFPPAASPKESPTTLPSQATVLIGRSEAVSEIDATLREQRLVTLVGTGGIGKTRLALEVAERALDRFPDGVWLVEFAPIVDPQAAALSIASALGVREAPADSPFEAVIDYLKKRTCLLVLDNCEHVVGEAARLAAAIVRAGTGLRVLATSREPLAVAEEYVYRVAPLSVPAPDSVKTVAELVEVRVGRTLHRACSSGGFSLSPERCRGLNVMRTLSPT